MRFLAAILLAAFVLMGEGWGGLTAHAQSSAGPDSIRVLNATGYEYVARDSVKVSRNEPKQLGKARKTKVGGRTRPLKQAKASQVVKVVAALRTIKGYALHQAAPGRLSLDGFPAPLVAKVRELESACGARLVSAFRPGARVRGNGARSLHASKRAVDMSGPPKCIYARMKGWPGGYSTDYSAVAHIHISYAKGSGEWGARFAHWRPRKTGVGG